jgi:diguanylate cyclase (GGDEF)-like protein
MMEAPRGPSSDTVHLRTLAGMFVSAGALVLVTLLLGVDESFNVPLIAALGAAGVVIGLIVVLAAPRLPAAVMGPGLLLAVGFTSTSVVASGEADTPFALMYIWIAVDSWYVLRPREAGALTAIAVIASGAAMASVAQEHDNALTWWVMVTGTTLTVAVVAAVLRLRADRLVAYLASAASRDPLTGLLNRRGFQESADREMASARRYDVALAVVTADLDHFKGVNDSFGHHSGDEALVKFAALCGASARSQDLIARVGGEEFAFLFPHTDGPGAVCMAERIRQGMRTDVLSPDGTPLTASFGVAEFPDDGDDVDTLLAAADRALYAAKSGGRDRTVAVGAVGLPAC